MSSLGFELVELERSTGGLLRVTIDYPWAADAAEQRSIGVDDCEAVSRQLQYALEVDDVDYRRLEVSSPGIDRPLRDARDFERFEGQQVLLVLKEPIAATDGTPDMAHIGRKRFRGRLQKAEGAPDRWLLIWQDEAPPGRRARRGAAKGQEQEGAQVLNFGLDELQSARLDPPVDFKRRQNGKERRTRARSA